MQLGTLPARAPDAAARPAPRFASGGSIAHLGPMESGGRGVPESGTPLERMPSSAESESAFSTATEAESEMTEAGDYEEGQSVTPRQTYFLSYATDCLSAYDLVKKRSLAGIRALDDVSVVAIRMHCSSSSEGVATQEQLRAECEDYTKTGESV